MHKRNITKGIILKTTPYGEADIIGVLLTDHCGIINFFARGAKKSKKRLGGGILPLDYATFEFTAPKKLDGLFELQTITERIDWSNLHTSTSFFCIACYLTELSLLFCKTDEDSGHFYFLLTNALTLLNKTSSHYEHLTILANSLITVLRISGISPEEDTTFRNSLEILDKLSALELANLIRSLIHRLELFAGFRLKSLDALNSFVLSKQ